MSEDLEKNEQKVLVESAPDDQSSSSKTEVSYKQKLFGVPTGQLSDYDITDVALRDKINLINDAIDEIGFTWYHFKLFCLNGLG